MFRNDYSDMCAPEILEALSKYMNEKNIGYGNDPHSKRAEELVLKAFGLNTKESACHFVFGGTQANVLGLSYFMRPYDAALCADSGHINVHETGALESTGHKIITIPNKDGKLEPSLIEDLMSVYVNEHMVNIKMVYISFSTETGTVYTLSELKEIRRICDKYNLILFIDGARLGVGLTSPGCDVSASDIGRIADVFYVGGTKNGLLYGEALIIKDKSKAVDFRYHIKNKLAMSAKGFVAGVQFERMFSDDLYFRLARNSNSMASYIKKSLEDLGFKFEGSSNTNQLFISLKREKAQDLMERFGLEMWSDDKSTMCVRIVTSFKTTKEECDALIDYIKENI